MLVQTKYSDAQTVIGLPATSGIGKVIAGSRLSLHPIPLRLYTKRERSLYSLQWLPDNFPSKIAHLKPDIETLVKLNRPLIFFKHVKM
jgi:hypothetical protein